MAKCDRSPLRPVIERRRAPDLRLRRAAPSSSYALSAALTEGALDLLLI
jgi:hypothetical protein